MQLLLQSKEPIEKTLLPTKCSDTVTLWVKEGCFNHHTAAQQQRSVAQGLVGSRKCGAQRIACDQGRQRGWAADTTLRNRQENRLVWCLSAHRLRLGRCLLHLHCLLVGFVQRLLHAPSLQRQLLAGAASSEPITQDALPRDLIRQACSPAVTAAGPLVLLPCWWTPVHFFGGTEP